MFGRRLRTAPLLTPAPRRGAGRRGAVSTDAGRRGARRSSASSASCCALKSMAPTCEVRMLIAYQSRQALRGFTRPAPTDDGQGVAGRRDQA